MSPAAEEVLWTVVVIAAALLAEGLATLVRRNRKH